MRLHSLRELVSHCLRKDPQALSLASLSQQLGISRRGLYRRFEAVPWERNRGSHNEGSLFTNLARILQEPRDKLLWFGGYNPFVARGLSARQMYLLYELLVRLVSAMQSDAKADLHTLVRLTLADLTTEANGGSKA